MKKIHSVADLSEEDADVLLHHFLASHFGDRVYVDADGSEHPSPKWAREKAAKRQAASSAILGLDEKPPEPAPAADSPKKGASRKAVEPRSQTGEGKGLGESALRKRRAALKRKIRLLRKAGHETK